MQIKIENGFVVCKPTILERLDMWLVEPLENLLVSFLCLVSKLIK